MSETRRRLLIVEDDDANRATLSTMLRHSGYEVREASDGEEAMGVLVDYRPDVVLLDLMMPWMDGRSFAEQAREQLEGIPTIVVSGARDVVEQAREFGAAGALRKPVRLADLLATIDRVLRGS